MLTIQVLAKNNESTIGKTLDSVKGLGDLVVGDIGCSDGTIAICKKHGAEVVKIKWEEDYSKARNMLIREGMNMYIEPWEVLAGGHSAIVEASENSYLYVVQNRILSKEIRLWRGLSFNNPAYETLVDSAADYLSDVVIVSDNAPDLRSERHKICKKWMSDKPTASEPYYYMAISCLAERRYEDFYAFGRQYLAMDRNASDSSIMLRYYMAQIELHAGDLKSASSNLLNCLCYKPEFAEFWCLLGDMLYKSQKYAKARCMYENAIIIGKRRKNNDFYPVEIDKYGDYPRKMIDNIGEIIKKTSLIGVDAL